MKEELAKYWKPYPGITRRFVDGPHGQLHLRVSGLEVRTRHVPLYCVHQSPSSSVSMSAVVSEMGKDRPCAAGDTPGFGESDPPNSPPEIQDYADSHAVMIDSFGWHGPIDLFGFFTGSKIAAAMALARPKLVRKLILFGAPLYTDSELKHEKAIYEPDKYEWDASHLTKWWAHLKAGAPQPYPLSLFTRHFAEIQRGGPNSWWGHRAAFNVDFREWLPRITQPTLILCSADPQGEKSQDAVDLLQNGTRLDVPHIGQGLLDLHTVEICDHIRGFLDH